MYKIYKKINNFPLLDINTIIKYSHDLLSNLNTGYIPKYFQHLLIHFVLLYYIDASIWWVVLNDVTDIADEKLRLLHDNFNKKIFGDIISR